MPFYLTDHRSPLLWRAAGGTSEKGDQKHFDLFRRHTLAHSSEATSEHSDGSYPEATTVPAEKSVRKIVSRIKKANAFNPGRITDAVGFVCQFQVPYPIHCFCSKRLPRGEIRTLEK